MRNRRRQLDMAHALTAYLRQSYFHPAAVADNALMFDAFVLSAIAFPIPRRPKYLLAEKPVLFRFKGTVINGLGFFDLAARPRPDHVGRRNLDRDVIETGRDLFVVMIRAVIIHFPPLSNPLFSHSS